MDAMKLLKFRVTNFRSVDDSGWIEMDNVTCLIGTNESGKTNLLVPLWKFNPAKEGEIDPMADYPRKRYHEIREMPEKIVFIEAWFELPQKLAQQIASVTILTIEDIKIVSISRDFSKHYKITFPNAKIKRSIPVSEVKQNLENAASEINDLKQLKAEEVQKLTVQDVIAKAQSMIDEVQDDEVGTDILTRIQQVLKPGLDDQFPKTSLIFPRFTRLLEYFESQLSDLTHPSPEDIPEVKDLIINNLPKFVYYSTYGNLDSEIYLPHVIDNLKRDNLGAHETAKARTLKVLFEFVNLSPQEIVELGKDIASTPNQPTEEEIKQTAGRKKERDILLTSASSQLTSSFRGWWKQGDYRFRFQADGNHFRIWVSDDRRPEDIELEGRSSGLQWFLSFYLVFLVESKNTHQGAILLLDEPGLTLHPIAQEDLSVFFENLSKTNQILYTTHSPFMVNPDQLDQVKVVYIDENGTTNVTVVQSDAIRRKTA